LTEKEETAYWLAKREGDRDKKVEPEEELEEEEEPDEGV
jgi:hypothetical protein